VDSKGKQCRGHECFIFGQIDKMSWFTQGHPDGNGKIVIHAPHGLENTNIDLVTNEHGVLRYRTTKGGPLHNSRKIKLGTLNDDVRGIELVRYVAPILLVSAVDQDGKLIKGFQAQAVYRPGKSSNEPGSTFINGIKGDVYFEKQDDGRWRSSQMFPDEEITVTVKADGYEPRTEKVKLAEGITRDLKMVLPKAGAKNQARK
jgi:hypothetical protein